MAVGSKIEWCDATWNPIAGCSKVSAGCKNCYAERMAKRLAAMGQAKYAGTVDAQGHWTGIINFDYEALNAPCSWKRPRRVFVNSMSDLFHEGVPYSFIDLVFAVMALCPQHTFLVLTKRPERMAAYLQTWQPRRIGGCAINMPTGQCLESLGYTMGMAAGLKWVDDFFGLPLPNVWLGTSIENQKTADERVPHLLKCPAAVRFLSVEPLLGGVELHEVHPFEIGRKEDGSEDNYASGGSDIHWVIVGGESGKNARPMHPDWVRSLRDQCVAADVPFFFKQWGDWIWSGPPRAGRVHDRAWLARDGETWFGRSPGCGGHAIAQKRGVVSMARLGKKRAGRVLDGREWNEFPIAAKAVM